METLKKIVGANTPIAPTKLWPLSSPAKPYWPRQVDSKKCVFFQLKLKGGNQLTIPYTLLVLFLHILSTKAHVIG